MPQRTTSDPTKTQLTLNYLGLGFKDYLGARALLIQGLCLQGAQLASTAVEKYLKAVMGMRGNSTKGHLGRAILNNIRNYDPSLMNALNQSFLQLLIRCYDLRYQDQTLKPGFNLVIVSHGLLAELDDTIAIIQKRFLFKKASGDRVLTRYEAAVDRKDPRLTDQNFVFLGIDKQSFVAARQPFCYEMRVDNTWGILEAEYVAEKGTWDDNFLIEGLRPGGSSAGA